ncbi:hypothetical protein [Ensifer adhaerens]|uniref:hypothetical protein n=1 Tax=Ensifer adhaerens TaxID=106592 RepID=UPI0023A9CBFE|nr:hypothetical protein [Ensifer adhaerens]
MPIKNCTSPDWAFAGGQDGAISPDPFHISAVCGAPQFSCCKYDYQNKQFFVSIAEIVPLDRERRMKVASANNETNDSMEPEFKATIIYTKSAAGAMRSTRPRHCRETIVVRAAAITRRGAGYVANALTT